MSRRPEGHRALIAAIERRYGALDKLVITSRPWASATFTGARHVLCFEMGMEEGAALVEGIAEADLPLLGHFVADIAVMRSGVAAGRYRLKVDALTVEDQPAASQRHPALIRSVSSTSGASLS